MVETAAEANEELMNKYLEAGDLAVEDIKKGLRLRTIHGEIFPMLCGSAFKNKGVQAMLDAVIDYMPSPIDIAAGQGHQRERRGRGASAEGRRAVLRACVQDHDRPVRRPAHVLPRLFRRGATRATRSTTRSRAARSGSGRILQMHANDREEIKEVFAGDIAAAVGLKDYTTGDTLTTPDKIITLEKMEFPEPVIHVAVEPKTKADQEKMGIALNRLAQEDPSFRVRTDEESGQTIISGMGELHLEIIVDRMKREFGVEANVGAPQVAYRETIRRACDKVEGKFIKQSGGRGQYGHVWLRLDPQGPGKGNEFVDAVKGGSVPREYIPAVKKGVLETLPNGVLAGFPVVDVKVTLFDGSYHEVDSNENAFKMAGSMALKDGLRMAGPVLLEPIMAVEVETPDDFMGNVVGDLSSRRGMIQGMEELVGGGQGDPRRSAARRDVRLLHHAALGDAGARDLQHGVQALLGGAEAACRGVDQQADRQGRATVGDPRLRRSGRCRSRRRVELATTEQENGEEQI